MIKNPSSSLSPPGHLIGVFVLGTLEVREPGGWSTERGGYGVTGARGGFGGTGATACVFTLPIEPVYPPCSNNLSQGP